MSCCQACKCIPLWRWDSGISTKAVEAVCRGRVACARGMQSAQASCRHARVPGASTGCCQCRPKMAGKPCAHCARVPPYLPRGASMTGFPPWTVQRKMVSVTREDDISRADLPRKDGLSTQIQYSAHVQHTARNRDVGDVRYPGLIGLRLVEVPIQQIGILMNGLLITGIWPARRTTDSRSSLRITRRIALTFTNFPVWR